MKIVLRMSGLKNGITRLALTIGMFFVFAFLLLRLQTLNYSEGIIFFSIAMLVAETITLFHLVGLYYCLWPRKYMSFDTLNLRKDLKVNLLICVCGEDINVIKKTVKGALLARKHFEINVSPHHKPTITILNDGKVAGKENWMDVIELSKSLGVNCITRNIPGGYKAGNINNALRIMQSSSPESTIDIVLDADMVPNSDLIIELSRPFSDQSVDFVQSPQNYKNRDSSWVSQAASSQMDLFYNIICPSKAEDNALFICGTNFAIKRSAIVDIGGFCSQTVAEDYETSIKLHLARKKGVYQSKILASGIAPTDLSDYFSQQTRWARGTIDASVRNAKSILFSRSLGVRQKFHYLQSSTYYLIGIRDMILISGPVLYLLTGIPLVEIKDMTIMFLYIPLMLSTMWVFLLLFKNPIRSLALQYTTFPVYAIALFNAFLNKKISFVVTNKKAGVSNNTHSHGTILLTACALWSVLIISTNTTSVGSTGVYLNWMWITYCSIIFTLSLLLLKEKDINFYLHRFKGFLSRTPLKNSLINYLHPILSFRMISLVVITLIILPIYQSVIFDHTSTISAQIVSQDNDETVFNLFEPENGVYYGYYLSELNSQPSSPIISHYSNDNPSLAMFYIDWQTHVNVDFINRLHESGVIPVITWEPWVISEKANYMDDETYEEILSGLHDEYIRGWADNIKKVNKPVMVRFAHEMNGDWYPWGDLKEDSSSQYILTWKHVHNIFSQNQVNNVLWVWSVNNTDAFGDSESITDFYPGSDYVDWVAFSGFNWGTSSSHSRWKSFDEISEDVYSILSQMGKPIMVAETSSVSDGGDKKDWFINTIHTITHVRPEIRAVIFFDEDYGNSNFKLTNEMNYKHVLNEHIIGNPRLIGDPIVAPIN